MRRWSIAALAFTLAIAGCGSDSSSDEDATEILAEDFQFEPATLPLEAGSSVRLAVRNNGDAEHNFSLDEADVNEDIEPGDSADVTLTAPDSNGTYTYYCEYHRGRGMEGTITVTGGTAASGSDTSGSSRSSGDGY